MDYFHPSTHRQYNIFISFSIQLFTQLYRYQKCIVTILCFVPACMRNDVSRKSKTKYLFGLFGFIVRYNL